MIEYHFIVNRHSSAGAGLLKWEEAQDYMRKHKIPYAVHFPSDEKETTDVTASLTGADSPPCHLIILGGDGTLNAVVQGIQSFEKTRFSCLAGGSANDFARDMGLSHNTRTALDSIMHDPTELSLDYGELLCQRGKKGELFRHRFLISSGIGYDAEICAIAEKSPGKHLLGRWGMGGLIYLIIGLALIFFGRYGRARIEIDGKESAGEIPLFIFAAMIHKYEGGGIAFCPDADPMDGTLDLCIVKKMPILRTLQAFVLLMQGKHMQLPEITVTRCRQAQVTVSRPEWFHMDGETPFRTKKIRFSIKNGLRFIY